MKNQIEKTGDQSPNDPKLSDCEAGRDSCVVCGKADAEAGGVTSVAVRCSAWLGDVAVDDIDEEIAVIKHWKVMMSPFEYNFGPIFSQTPCQGTSRQEWEAETERHLEKLSRLRRWAISAGQLVRKAPSGLETTEESPSRQSQPALEKTAETDNSVATENSIQDSVSLGKRSYYE